MSRRQLAVMSVWEGSLLALALSALPACGGKAHASDLEPRAGSGQGGSAGSGAAAVQGGTSNLGGTTGEGGTIDPGSGGEPAEPFRLDDAFPWFDGAGSGDFPYTPEDRVVHIVASDTPARATRSTHNLVDLLAYSDAIQFSARASEPMKLIVSASHTVQPYDYFTDRDAGHQWPIAYVNVDTDWRDFTVPLSDLQPPDTAAPGIPSFSLAFIVENPTPLEVWIDKVSFRPAPSP